MQGFEGHHKGFLLSAREAARLGFQSREGQTQPTIHCWKEHFGELLLELGTVPKMGTTASPPRDSTDRLKKTPKLLKFIGFQSRGYVLLRQPSFYSFALSKSLKMTHHSESGGCVT